MDRNEDEGLVHKLPVIYPVAVGQVADGVSGSGSGIRACRVREDILHNNAASQRPFEHAVSCDEDELLELLPRVPKECAAAAQKAFISRALLGAAFGVRLSWYGAGLLRTKYCPQGS